MNELRILKKKMQKITGIWIKHPQIKNLSANVLTGEIRYNKTKLALLTRADLYQQVCIKEYGTKLVHRLVLECKLQRMIKEGFECNHINHVPFDNRADNLEEVSIQQNRKDKKQCIQNMSKTPKCVAMVIKDEDDNDLTLYFKSQYACSKYLGISTARVYQICTTNGNTKHNLSYMNTPLPEGRAFVKTTTFKKDNKADVKQRIKQKNHAYYLKNKEKLKAKNKASYLKRLMRETFGIPV